ncbi:MAG: 4Fe-4S dicluster domain-containing protein, partial [Gemmatimonadetes bacterium]|nr:4Fe-4S dicluster domain-containing protein [Gemmatimonadota bacterium]
FYDGRLANRPWLQELPDPVSKMTWNSWVEISPAAAAGLGLDDGHIVEVETPYGKAELPVWRHPGLRADAIAVQIGQGHTAHGRYAEQRGVNAAALIGAVVEEASGALVWQQTRATLRPTGEWRRLPQTEGSKTQQGRQVLRETTLADARAAEGHPEAVAAAVPPVAPEAQPEAAAHAGTAEVRQARAHEEEVHPREKVVRQLQALGGFAPADVEAGPGEYPPPGTDYGEYSEDLPRWGMAIDLERCIGCSACVTACYAENNIGVVGPEQVTKGRIQHWIRIERYFSESGSGSGSGSESGKGEGEGRTGAAFLPMLCQHCGNAPCEPVCPVYAAYHTPDGLNAQIYNRCVGTRYCANNCPYKVRYFNWYTWEFTEPLHWQLNPDVAVREKGVMEKCTFCVQRIRDAENRARFEERTVRDGEIVPACAQTCPGEAIVFGNVKDPNSRVARLAASGRGYRVLEELNTQSAITYLKRVVAEAAEA